MRAASGWAWGLTLAPDIQAAVSLIARSAAEGDTSALDLRRINLQGAELIGAFLKKANLGGAHLEGADLGRAHLEGADLRWAHLEGADLGRAHLEGADLRQAHLEGALLWGAHLEGADLREAHLEGAHLWQSLLDDRTNLSAATLRGAALMSVNLARPATNEAFHDAFGDGSVILPEGYEAGKPPLDHWATEELGHEEFDRRWRAWQAGIGYTPPE